MFAHRLSMAKKYGRSWLENLKQEEQAMTLSLAKSANYLS
jgi:hypothetical protein